MDYLQYTEVKARIKQMIGLDVLNLIINGLPSIHKFLNPSVAVAIAF